MIRDLFSLRLFVRVARLGSFSAAARELNLSQPQASRIISDLEKELGVVLLTRTTRAVVLNDSGADYLARVEPVLAALDEASEITSGRSAEGNLRVGMPTSMALRTVISRLPLFLRLNPNIRLHVIMEDRTQDLVREAVDVAIRVGELRDSSATAKLIVNTDRIIIAAPSYLTCHGTPARPEDLSGHKLIGGPATQTSSAWSFRPILLDETVDAIPFLTLSDNEGAVAAAVAGLGLTSTTELSCREELDNGSLVRVLKDWVLPKIPVHAYFPMGRGTRHVARVFIDYLIAEIKQPAP